MEKRRCSWVNLNNPLYVNYHDNEWGIIKYEDDKLFEALALEMLQSGLSFECILNKREALNQAFRGFRASEVALFNEGNIKALMANKSIIRHERKIRSIINNARAFIEISKEFNGFINYLFKWTNGMVIKEESKGHSELSDAITKDLKMRGMSFIGTTTIYSYLEAVGVIDSHSLCCYKHRV